MARPASYRFLTTAVIAAMLAMMTATAIAMPAQHAAPLGVARTGPRPVLPPLPSQDATVRAAALAQLAPNLRRGFIRVTSPAACWQTVLHWRERAYQIFALPRQGGAPILFPMLTGVAYGATPDPDRGQDVCRTARALVIAWFPFSWIAAHPQNRAYATALYMANWAQEKAAGWSPEAYPADTSLDPFGVMMHPAPPMPDAERGRG